MLRMREKKGKRKLFSLHRADGDCLDLDLNLVMSVFSFYMFDFDH